MNDVRRPVPAAIIRGANSPEQVDAPAIISVENIPVVAEQVDAPVATSVENEPVVEDPPANPSDNSNSNQQVEEEQVIPSYDVIPPNQGVHLINISLNLQLEYWNLFIFPF